MSSDRDAESSQSPASPARSQPQGRRDANKGPEPPSMTVLPVVPDAASSQPPAGLAIQRSFENQIRDWISCLFAWGCALGVTGVFLWLIGGVVWQGAEAILKPPAPQVTIAAPGRDRQAEPTQVELEQPTEASERALASSLSRLGEFVATEPQDAGRQGGILPMLVSTLLVILICVSVALPLGVGTAVYLAEFTQASTREQWTGRIISRGLDILAATPSIVFGLFGNAFFCRVLGWGDSILAGGLTLACMVLPILIRVTDQGLRAVPQAHRYNAAALGLSQWTTLTRIILPAAMPAIAAGLVLGIGRALSETAALIFTSGYSSRMPGSVFDSGRTLSVHIYEMAMNVSGGNGRAFATAGLLVLLLLLINAIATFLTRQATAWATGKHESQSGLNFHQGFQ